MFRLTRSSEFPRCWVIVSPGCSEKNTVPPVTREVTEDRYVNWCPPCLSCVRFVPCCHCLCIRSFVPCHWNAGLLCLFGLKEYGLGTQSLGRWIVHCSRLELHRLIIRTWHTAWRPEQQHIDHIITIFNTFTFIIKYKMHFCNGYWCIKYYRMCLHTEIYAFKRGCMGEETTHSQ